MADSIRDQIMQEIADRTGASRDYQGARNDLIAGATQATSLIEGPGIYAIDEAGVYSWSTVTTEVQVERISTPAPTPPNEQSQANTILADLIVEAMTGGSGPLAQSIRMQEAALVDRDEGTGLFGAIITLQVIYTHKLGDPYTQ